MGYQWHRVHPFTFDDCIGLLYELGRLLSWELPICFMYSQKISREKLYQKFSDNVMNIQPIFLRVWVEKKFAMMPWTYRGNISTTSLVLKANLWRGGTLNVISAHDVLVDHCYTTTSGCCYYRINCQQIGLSQTIQRPVSTSLEKVAIIVMCMGNWTRLTDIVVCDEEWQYRYHWLRVLAEVGSSECIRLIPLIAQGTRVRSWGCGHQSSKLSSSSEISPNCNVCLS